MSSLSEKHREAVRASNYRRSEQTREMNRNRVWTPEMRAKMLASKRRVTRKRIQKQIDELGVHPFVYARWENEHGYVIVSVYEHPILGTRSIGEHRLILAERLGRKPTSEEHGHHVNEIRNDNSPSNIELMSQSEHMSHHARKRRWSEERKRRLSEKMKGRPVSQALIDKLTGVPLVEEHRNKIREKVKAACAAKRAAGTHKRGPDSEEVKARKKAAAQAAWDKRRAAGPVKFRPRTQDEKDQQSIRMSETWERRRAAKQD